MVLAVMVVSVIYASSVWNEFKSIIELPALGMGEFLIMFL